MDTNEGFCHGATIVLRWWRQLCAHSLRNYPGERSLKKLMEIMELQADIDTLFEVTSPRRSGRRNGSTLAWKPSNALWR